MRLNVESDVSNGSRGLTVKVNDFPLCLAIQNVGEMGSGISFVHLVRGTLSIAWFSFKCCIFGMCKPHFN